MTTYLPGIEGVTVARWAFARLTTDPTLQGMLGGAQEAQNRVVEGVYAGSAPTWITFTILEPRDVKGVGMVQIMSMVQFQMKVVGKGASYGPLVPIYQRAHELLEGQTNQEPTQGGIVLTAQRVSGIQYPERAGGIEYRHLGGLYETLTQ
jgi:hypothetical protein